MTASQLRRIGSGAALVASLLLLVGSAAADHHGDPPIEMVSTNVQGKNVYIPGMIVMTAGKPHTITVFNTTDTPHGFTIEGTGVEAVLPPKVEHKVEVPSLRPGIYRIDCQLHPPHRSAQLLVVEAAK